MGFAMKKGWAYFYSMNNYSNVWGISASLVPNQLKYNHLSLGCFLLRGPPYRK